MAARIGLFAFCFGHFSSGQAGRPFQLKPAFSMETPEFFFFFFMEILQLFHHNFSNWSVV